MSDSSKSSLQISPLSVEDLACIDATSLTSIERHHLRLLAHCLACFKSMANGVSIGPLPNELIRREWFLKQPSLFEEKEFISVLLKQFAIAAGNLERLATDCGVSPLELTLEHLISEGLEISKRAG